MTKYLDGTEAAEESAIPRYCPICRGKLVTRWVGISAHSRKGPRARAFPVRTCLPCKVSAQVRQLPSKPLRATRKAARADAEKANEYINDITIHARAF